MSPTALTLRRLALKRRFHAALIDAWALRCDGATVAADLLADAAEAHWRAGCRALEAMEGAAEAPDPGLVAVAGCAAFEWPLEAAEGAG